MRLTLYFYIRHIPSVNKVTCSVPVVRRKIKKEFIKGLSLLFSSD